MLTLSKNYPILVDDEAKSQTLKFWGSDSKESYSKNFKSGWEYENSEDLVYEFNDWGYRTKNIDDLDKDFAILWLTSDCISFIINTFLPSGVNLVSNLT